MRGLMGPNLAPKSVFDELVALFVAAKAKCQVIMVTHSPNLVYTGGTSAWHRKAAPSSDSVLVQPSVAEDVRFWDGSTLCGAPLE